MSDDWMSDPRMHAAAMEGISENRAFPLEDRLKAAQQAITLPRKHIEGLEEQLEAARDFDERAGE